MGRLGDTKNRAVLRAVLGAAAAWLICACPGDGSASTGNSSDVTAGANAGASSCPTGALCFKGCSSAAACDKGGGGYACLPSTTRGDPDGVTMAASSAMGVARAPSTPTVDSDADAGPVVGPDENRNKLVSLAPGFCAATCSTELCTDPHAVCSGLDGVCRAGCDKTRPSCAAGQACDFSPKVNRCFDLDGHCMDAGDCPKFDERLERRGAISCENHRCRYRQSSPDVVRPLQSPIATRLSNALNVQAPTPGQRFTAENLAGFAFQFDLPAPVLVATILVRPISDLEDGAKASVWTAYLDSREARNGVTLAAGGEIREGVWQRYAPGEVPSLQKGQYYFLVLGYDHGQLIAQSELVPFSVGPDRTQPGAPCVELQNNWFCDPDSALLCVDRVCRMPCLSDDDCPDGRACSEPGVAGIAARLCM